MKILFFQYGNFVEAYQRLQAGEAETYREQQKSVGYVADLAPEHDVTVVAMRDASDDATLAPGLRSITVRKQSFGRAEAVALLDRFTPDLVICRTPNLPMLAELKRRSIRTFPCLADTIAVKGLRSRIDIYRLRQVLRGPHIPGIANHNLNASMSVARAFHTPTDRILSWDWEAMTPFGPLKSGVADPCAPTAFYAGTLKEAKGIPEALEAVRLLRAQGVEMRLALAGRGDVEAWQARADALGIGDLATFLGRIENATVRDRMMSSDIVLIPSRHEYDEGLPNTLYEGLASGSALVISDHRAFVGRLAPERDCLMFRSGDAASLAACITRLAGDPGLYRQLSENASTALSKLTFGVEWTELIGMYIADPDDRTGWVEAHSLAAMDVSPAS